jgi:hypothetical protein
MHRSVAIRLAWGSLTLFLLLVFVRTFNPGVNGWLVNLSWLAALAVWSFGICLQDRAPRIPAFDSKYVWPILFFVPVFAALWLPFYDNWRWMNAGDSLGWFGLPSDAAKHGLARSILSANGVFGLFTYTEVIVVNAFMFIFAPTLFWHRVGNFVISTLSLLAIYSFFSLVLRFPWALAVVIATAATWHWQIMSHFSWNHIDSFIFAYLTLTAFTLILRDPERRTRWLALGVVGGLSLFFTATAWAEVAACGVAIGVWALYRRKVVPLAIAGATFLIAGLPMLLQLPQFLGAARAQTRIAWDWTYLSRIFRSILWLPAGRNLAAIGFNDAFASRPCGDFYFVGLGIAALSIVPWVRRRFQLPPAAFGLLCLFLAEAALMALTNNQYGSPSCKRTYHLIPLQAFFALLPLYTFAMALRAWSFGYRAVTATAFLAVGIYVVVSASLLIYPTRFGGNVYDGLVQVHQRFPDRKVLVFSPQPWIGADLANPNTIINQVYHVGETVAATGTIDDDLVGATCSAGTMLCEYMQPGTAQQFGRATAGHKLRKVDLNAVEELQCFECN